MVAIIAGAILIAIFIAIWIYCFIKRRKNAIRNFQKDKEVRVSISDATSGTTMTGVSKPSSAKSRKYKPGGRSWIAQVKNADQRIEEVNRHND